MQCEYLVWISYWNGVNEADKSEFWNQGRCGQVVGDFFLE